MPRSPKRRSVMDNSMLKGIVVGAIAMVVLGRAQSGYRT